MNMYMLKEKCQKNDFVQNRGSSPQQGKMNLYKIRKNYYVHNKSKFSCGACKTQGFINLFFFIIRNMSGLYIQIPFFFRGVKNE